MNPLSEDQNSGMTRRSFVKKSVLTLGAVAILSQGTALANTASSLENRHCGGGNASCLQFIPTDNTVYFEPFMNPGGGLGVRFFKKGRCKCSAIVHNPAYFDAIQTQSNTVAGMVSGSSAGRINHTMDGHPLPMHYVH